MKNLLLIFLLTNSLKLFAQDCNCRVNFDYMTSKVSRNYSGYRDKINAGNKEKFTLFTKELREKASAIKTTDACFIVLKTWTNYFQDQHLKVQLNGDYKKANPAQTKEINAYFLQKKEIVSEQLSGQTEIQQLDEQTLLLRLPSFEWSEKKMIDSLLKSQQALLKKTPNWIIDIRGNGGGTDYTFQSLIPYLYTQAYIGKPDEYWSSEDNIAILEKNLKGLNPISPQGNFLKAIISLMKKHPGQFVNPLGKDTFSNTLDSSYTYPKKIGILISRETLSSAESFLLIAKQSKKVTLFGENSGGSLDYANTQYFDIPCDDYSLAIAISRSKRLPENPIDNIGIPPDVKINPLEKDKVRFVQQQLKLK